MVVLCPKYYSVNKIKEDMGRTSSMHGEIRNAYI
jgi:hypothetical protein